MIASLAVIGVVGFLLLLLVSAGVGAFVYLRTRPPSELVIAESLNMESWTAVPPDAHHSNTDMIKFKDRYVMAHATSPWHFASVKCRMIIRTSLDGVQWTMQREIGVHGQDVRDPTFAVIDNKLYLYLFPNMTFDPKPHDTLYCESKNGLAWTEPKKLDIEDGWLLWRPHTFDGVTFYVPAYRRELGRVSLFNSTDGIKWSEVGTIYQGENVTETDLIFRPDGTMLMTARIEMNPSYWGHHPQAHTLIGAASPPYTDWNLSRSYETRLDGPCLFQIGARTYACGRRHLGGPEWMGSCWGRKRTSLYLVEPDRLVFLSDLPSCGDTAYAGAVVDVDSVLICYYTSPPGRDWFWLMGMLSKSSIEVARFKIADLERLADTARGR